MIRVLFLTRADIFKLRAGDTVQVSLLAEYLRKKGLTVSLSTRLKPDLDQYDLVHYFNILRTEGSYQRCLAVKEKGIPLLITPIYWNVEQYLAQENPAALTTWRIKQEERRRILKLADLIVPNAELEWEQLERDFRTGQPYRIIYNGVEDFFYGAPVEPVRNHILMVGRIHRSKNQLGLIKALRGSGLKLTMIGDINDHHYYRLCRQEADQHIEIKAGVNRRELRRLYRDAAVHVLPSWYDTPGLVSLEAGLAGCKLVSTERGTAREYFKDYAEYCVPDDLSDIRTKVLRAVERKPEPELPYYILNNFTWQRVAEKTRQIYSELLSFLI